MTEVNLTQSEADFLFKIEKHRANEDVVKLPYFGGYVSVPLISNDKRENFLLDVRRGRIDLKRQTFQNRVRDVIILARIDINSPHRNPDGEEIGVPHIHRYREGFNDKWAYKLPQEVFKNTDDFWQVLQDFMMFCNVVNSPNFEKELFS